MKSTFLHRFFAAITLLLAIHLPTIAQSYTWKNVAMGGGGFVSGLVTSKRQQNLLYARTDVGGAYRWNAATSSWIPLLDWASESETGYQGVESLAIDPQAPNKLYMLAGTSYFNNGKTAILRSSDYGATFSITDVSNQFKAHGNGMGRNNGEKLQVDPNNGNILYCGTRRNGLFKSIDAGVSWSQNASLGTIVTANDNGISFVVIDSTSGTPGNASQTIIAGISQTTSNLYISTNGGSSFALIAGAPTGYMPQRAVLASDKNLYITYANLEGPWNPNTGQIWKYNLQTAAWVNVTPGGTTFPYSGISIDPANPQRLIASTINVYNLQYASVYGDRFYLSTNGGATWRNLVGSGITLDPNGTTWVNGQSIHWAASMEFDPFNTNKAWVVSGNGVFTCNDVNATTTTWAFAVKGLEETVPLDMVSITGGPMFSVIGDYDGFKHIDVTQYAPIHSPRMGTTTGIAYAALNTNKLVRVGSNMYYTTDQGNSWVQCTLNGSQGKVALSADGNTFLHSPAGSSTTYRSVNNGASWTASTGISISSAIPVADPANANKFYAYNSGNGSMFVSTDGGASFAAAGSAGSGGSKIIRTAPGYEGHLWVALYNGGLKRSINSGNTFTAISGVTACSAVGLGKAAPGASYYTIYIWGTVNGVLGIHRSIDEGATWARLNDDAHEYGGPGNGQFVMGDMNVYGRVYMSTVGRGIVYGEPGDPLPITLASFSGFLNQKEQAQLQWKTVAETANDHFEIERSLNGTTFIPVASIASLAPNGTSNHAINYTYADDVSNLKGPIYYRLKQVNTDGKYTYSGVVSMNKKAAIIETVQAIPNPVMNQIVSLKIQVNAAKNGVVRISDIRGNVISKAQSIPFTVGDNIIRLPRISGMSSGIYLIEVIDEKNNITIARNKMVVQ